MLPFTSPLINIRYFVFLCICLTLSVLTIPAFAATSIPFTINLSEAVTVTGTPRIAVDVGGVTRYATYTSGTGTSALTFTYTMVAGDVDLDGVTISSPMDLNGGTVKDLAGNDATLSFTPPNTTNVKVNYPSLGMDFVADADGRYTLNGTAYNDLTSFLSAAGGTFSRTSVGTYFDSAGVLQTAASGVPRFDYDPVTHAAKGILIEESRTNLILQSNAFTTSPWDTATCGGGVSNSGSTTIAPNGASTPIYDFSTTSCLFQDISITNGSTYTHSIWIKANQSATIGFRNPGSSSFTSTNITVGTTWQRYIITATADQAFSRFLIDNRAASGYGVSGLKLSLFGAQLEQGSFSTSYISTTTTAVTRAAEVLQVPVGSWYSSTESTLLSDSILTQGVANSFISILYESGTDYIGNRFNSSIYVNPRRNDGVGADLSLGGTFAANASSKIALYNGTVGARSSRDGGAIVSSATVISPTINTLQIGGFNTAGGLGSVAVQKTKYYPARVSDTQLQLLTQ